MASGRYETPRERCLDSSVFEPGAELVLHRLVTSGRNQLDGLASAKYPGRWNRVGQPTIYTSLAISTAIAEVLHHIESDQIPSNYTLMTLRLRVPQRLAPPKRKPPSSALGQTTELNVAQMRIFESISKAEAAMESPNRHENPFAIAVPSIRAPAWNVVLYPEVPTFWDHVSLVNQEPFKHDLHR